MLDIQNLKSACYYNSDNNTMVQVQKCSYKNGIMGVREITPRRWWFEDRRKTIG